MAGVLALAVVAGCADTGVERAAIHRAPLGEAVFQALCDRVGAQSLAEDAEGLSFRPVCHPDASGHYGDTVDRSKLPPVSGQAALVREIAVAKVEAMARHRDAIIAAVEKTLPDAMRDPFQALTKRMIPLYTDGTVPDATRALAAILARLGDDPDAPPGTARLLAEKGYSPYASATGLPRAFSAYPRSVDLTQKALALVAPYSDPADTTSAPGPAHAALAKLLEAAGHTLASHHATPLGPAVIEIAPGVIERPRSTSELLYALQSTEDPALASGGPPILLVRRDERGLALPTTIVDADHDGYADAAVTGFPDLPSPFPALSMPDGKRDALGRVDIWQYIDADRTLGADTLRRVGALAAPGDASNPSDLLALVLGAEPLLGDRVDASKHYDDGATVSFKGFDTSTSPVFELVNALAMLLRDPRVLDLLQYSVKLGGKAPDALARVVAAANEVADLKANKYPDLHLPDGATFWDDMQELFGEIAHEPGLMEDLIRSQLDPDSDLATEVYPKFLTFKDAFTYDPADVNGPPLNLTVLDAQGKPTHADPQTPVDRSKAEVGENRSILHRMMFMTHETMGVTLCNKESAVVHAKDVPGAGDTDYPDGINVIGPLHACQVTRIDDAGALFVAATAGMAEIEIRDPALANAASDHVQEVSTGVTGMTLHPTAGALVRFNSVEFVDFGDPTSPSFPPPPEPTLSYLKDLLDVPATTRCPLTPVKDPFDGTMVPTRTCAKRADTFWGRWGTTAMALDHFDFFRAGRPLARAFARHGRPDLLAKLFDTLRRHWPGDEADADECPPGAKQGDADFCSKAGLVRYEPFLADVFATDLLPALRNLSVAADGLTIASHVDGGPVDGPRVVGELLAGALDPAAAKARGVTDAVGHAGATRGDGTPVAQTTPVRLVFDALDQFDARFAAQPDKKALWDRGRKALVDQLFATEGSGANAHWKYPGTSISSIKLAQLLGEQIAAHCPAYWQQPVDTNAKCAWVDTQLMADVKDALGGPLVASLVDLVDAFTADADARVELEKFTAYLLDGSNPDAFAALVSTLVDAPMALNDDAVGQPLMRALAPALEPGTPDQPAAYDALLRLLTRTTSDQIDPDRVMNQVLANLYTPMGPGEPAPVQVFADAVGDIQRYDSSQASVLAPGDVPVASNGIHHFLTDKTTGLEQLYTILHELQK